jgi:Uma2 family endonuclease
MATNQFVDISPDEYLAAERVSPIKHEYRRGQVYAMSGANKAHVAIVSNLIALLGNHLQNSPCWVMASQMKVHLEAANCYYYPDVLVTCHPDDLTGTEDDYIHYPKLVIEVLSKSTASFDRGEKFVDYQTCPTLEEYLLIDQTKVEILRYFLRDGVWVKEAVADRLYLSSIQCDCSVADIYRKVPGLEV